MGGGKGSTPAPIVTTPEAAPAVEQAEALEMAEEEDVKAITEAQKKGSKSLQIPVGGSEPTTTTSAVGTA